MLFSLVMLPAALEPPNSCDLVLWTKGGDSLLVESAESISRMMSDVAEALLI